MRWITKGRVAWSAYFDPDARAAASAELFERWAASNEHGVAPVVFDAVRAWNAHDLERLRALLPADFYLDDRRRTGVGRLDGAETGSGRSASRRGRDLSRGRARSRLGMRDRAPGPLAGAQIYPGGGGRFRGFRDEELIPDRVSLSCGCTGGIRGVAERER